MTLQECEEAEKRCRRLAILQLQAMESQLKSLKTVVVSSDILKSLNTDRVERDLVVLMKELEDE